MEDYLEIFIDEQYPTFLDKYLSTSTLERLKYITQFCGCDYTKLYSPLFTYTRFFHSVVVAHMTWHFTHNKKETIVALLHDVGTPCFAHTIDIFLGDAINQESSEKDIIGILKNDRQLIDYLEEDQVSLNDFKDYSKFPILENKSPNLCTDRLDGVLHTCYVWLHTHSLEQIQEVYDDLVVLKNSLGNPEIGFKTQAIAEKFVQMVYVYAHELQGNTDKYVNKYIAELVKISYKNGLISLDDLYTKKETDICEIFNNNFKSWKSFVNAETISRSDTEPQNSYYVSFDTKKRNAIPLIQIDNNSQRINIVSEYAQNLYKKIETEKDTKYGYIGNINKL